MGYIYGCIYIYAWNESEVRYMYHSVVVSVNKLVFSNGTSSKENWKWLNIKSFTYIID